MKLKSKFFKYEILFRKVQFNDVLQKLTNDSKIRISVIHFYKSILVPDIIKMNNLKYTSPFSSKTLLIFS
jgi:hypothetical protein